MRAVLMDPNFMMGSMGTVVGGKKLPVCLNSPRTRSARSRFSLFPGGKGWEGGFFP